MTGKPEAIGSFVGLDRQTPLWEAKEKQSANDLRKVRKGCGSASLDVQAAF